MRDCVANAKTPVKTCTTTPWRNKCIRVDELTGGQRRGTYRREASHKWHRNKRHSFDKVEQVKGTSSTSGDVLCSNLGVGISGSSEDIHQNWSPTDIWTLIKANTASGNKYVGSGTVKSVIQPSPPTFSCSKGKSHNRLTPRNIPKETGA